MRENIPPRPQPAPASASPIFPQAVRCRLFPGIRGHWARKHRVLTAQATSPAKENAPSKNISRRKFQLFNVRYRVQRRPSACGPHRRRKKGDNCTAATADDIRSRHWYGPGKKSRSRSATIVKRTCPQEWPGEAPARVFSCRTARPRRPRLPAPPGSRNPPVPPPWAWRAASTRFFYNYSLDTPADLFQVYHNMNHGGHRRASALVRNGKALQKSTTRRATCEIDTCCQE